jgi:hypothetical protein
VRDQLDDTLRFSMVLETETFFKHLFGGEGRLETLLLASYSFVDEPLAKLYGVAPTGPFTRVNLIKEQRSGILTQASFLFLKPGPSARGTWLINKLLCTAVPEPPNGAVNPVVDPFPGETTRQTLERSVSGPSCAACHQLIDPPGFAFGHYDALGRWRDQEAGQPIDATGMFRQTRPAPLKFDGARQLGEQLLGSCEVRRCVAQMFLQRALGGPKPIDEASVAEVAAAFEASDLNLRVLFEDVAASRPFLAP